MPKVDRLVLLKLVKMVYTLAYIGVVQKVIAFVIALVCYYKSNLSLKSDHNMQYLNCPFLCIQGENFYTRTCAVKFRQEIRNLKET